MTILTRQEIEKREHAFLAPYAMKSSETRGRRYEEEEHPYRTVYQRDRDRIIYSTAFRRMEYKTQVFVNHEGDYYRTRLTHTLEVAQISRTIARALRLNEDLVEALALAHDLGHAPFGHAGESTLQKLMTFHGGFDHNTHGLRVVDVLEKRYPNFCGLNLSEEVRRGFTRHSTPFDKNRASNIDVPGILLLEIQVVNIADEIAYDNHDLDDGLKSGLVVEQDLVGVDLWDISSNEIKRLYPNIDEKTRRYQAVRKLINLHVQDVIDTTVERMSCFNIKRVEDLENRKEIIIDFSEGMKKKRATFKDVLKEKLYRNYRVVRMTNKASRFLESLFKIYCDSPEQLSPQNLENMERDGKHRVICDYMAGMTDRYALDQYKKFFEPYERV